jgi:hypothetical protein
MDSQLDDFKNLRRLLALKRHEQPPRGYFDTFSREVSFRVQAGETVRETAAERLNAEAPWLQRFLEILLAKPQWSGAVGALACALILGVVLFVERNDLRPTVTGDVSPATLAVSVDQPSFVFNQPLIQPQVAALTNASLQPNIPEGLFNAPDLKVTPVDQPGAVWLKH